MAKNKYIADYRLLEYIDEKGHVHSSYEYIGSVYRFSAEPARLRRSRLTASLLCVVLWGLFLGALLINSAAMRTFYVSLPFAFAALPLGSCTGSLLSLYPLKDTLERRESERLTVRYPDSLVWLIILTAVPFAASLVRFAVSAERMLPGDILFPVFSGLMAACAAVLLKWKNELASFAETD